MFKKINLKLINLHLILSLSSSIYSMGHHKQTHEEIFILIYKKDAEKVKSLFNNLENEINVNAVTKDNNNTLLMAAAISNLIDIVELLIQKGADIHKQNIYKNTAIILASLNGHVEIVECLLKNGANFDIRANETRGNTPLLYAVESRNEKLVKLLIKYKVNFNLKDCDGFSPFMMASLRGLTKIARLLIDAGADVKERSKNGWTPLMFAARNNYKDVAKLLIDSGANVNDKDNEGCTVLMRAAEFAHKEMFDLLINSGAKIDEKNNLGKTVLEHANSDQKIIINLIIYTKLFNRLKNMLEKINKNTDQISNLNKELKNTKEKLIEIVNKFIKDKRTLRFKDENGNNLLHLAVIFQNKEIFNWFLSLEVSLINQENNAGYTPLIINPAFDNYSYLKKILFPVNEKK